jgi:23S rRNA pseudouridine1911/1915/1917 synthase
MPDAQTFDFEVPAARAGERLDAVLAALCRPYSRTQIKGFIEGGKVRVDGLVQRRPRSPVQVGQRLALEVPPATDGGPTAQAVEFRVAYEDDDVLVVDKPAGLVVHPGAGNPHETLVNGLLFHDSTLAALPRAGLIHRLDKDTSGLLLVARTPFAFQALTAQMARREIHRTYAAIVHGVMVAGGTVDAAVGRDRRQRTRMRVAAGGRTAVTHYRVVARFRAHTHLEVALETGRTHQIRVHMLHLGYPLVGDPTYGIRHQPPQGASASLVVALGALRRQALHAKALAFAHPVTGRALHITSSLPTDLRRLLRALATDRSAAAAANA